ncbi:MAG: hypothetical protein A2977_02030 [Alphaproteobacteria bacterium RIFCSPLOWO2_01_FULL_45_8]|nr:MAG: hypothetical protein A2065_03985 [Alphaproteobacteria bacterium GWB1_45_5]OFW76361.1 MAG: hypothetical protein A3K20_02485 [Alphaproteobacteria bacterium GWA1_45_9]OFW89366.1 MAG: hypothetical protein A2621_00305 [Alphaproteobacteria bacterium RIFCSPHIGHO2_01_FULL_41_14]OFW96355.1 MAG: hypothetical protein A2977_02030 [Alphaproteobacteria bacterium RIFCSPLOWO2_01_FULL_45_8]HCI48758.1 hypothetical protein [Holosporales bacterium]
MGYLKIGSFLFTFLYSCHLLSFPPFSENECPTLTSSQLCQISSGKNPSLTPNHSSKNLLKNACHIQSETVFEGSPKGTVYECGYVMPQEWDPPLASSAAQLTIYTRTLHAEEPTQQEMGCPKLSFKTYNTLAAGHTFGDRRGNLWRSQKRSALPKLPKNKVIKHLPPNGPLFIEHTRKKTWVVCRYIFNNFPITIKKEKS